MTLESPSVWWYFQKHCTKLKQLLRTKKNWRELFLVSCLNLKDYTFDTSNGETIPGIFDDVMRLFILSSHRLLCFIILVSGTICDYSLPLTRASTSWNSSLEAYDPYYQLICIDRPQQSENFAFLSEHSSWFLSYSTTDNYAETNRRNQ